ncbi:hypothetical protein ACO1MT_15175, partial [Staphylococcus aureus]
MVPPAPRLRPSIDELDDVPEVEQTRISRRAARAATPPLPALHLMFSTQRSVDTGPRVILGRR